MVPLIIVDATRGTGHFNLAQGIMGTAVGIGASLSTTLGGYACDRWGITSAFLLLAGVAATGLVVVLAFMPETGELQAER
jgi:predicted MFS family arabinose efflux permease